MSNYVTLLGSENVERAGHSMSSAAQEMKSAANQIDSSVQDLKRFMDDWLVRLQAVLEAGHEATK